jgi:apolipoprotein N-acyltransferase
MVQIAPFGGVVVVIAFSALLGLGFRVTAMIIRRFGTSSMLWAVPLAFVGQEVLRSESLPRFRCSYLAWGYSQSHNPWIAQIASIGGVYFVSLLLVAFNAAVAYGLIRRQPKNWAPAIGIAVFIAALGVVSQPSVEETGPSLNVACIQGEDIPYDHYLEIAREAFERAPSPDILVLPEHTTSNIAGPKHYFASQLKVWAKRHKAHICVGVHVEAPTGSPDRWDNVALLIGPDGSIIGQQSKAVPVPSFIDGNPAREQAIFETPAGKIGMFVCYDGVFTDIPRRLTDLGADYWLVPVMDPQHWPNQQHWLHADMASFRSIEERRCAVRAASSGVSDIIDSSGRALKTRMRDEGPGFVVGAIRPSGQRTHFARWGFLIAPAICIAFLASIVFFTVEERVRPLRAERN